MKHASIRFAALAPVLLALFAGCDGSSSPSDVSADTGKPELTKVEFGRLVDVYAYRRVDSTHVDRRDRLHRLPVLVQRDVVVSASIESQALFDAGGQEIRDANYEFRVYDKAVGHDELLILWDDRASVAADEAQRFQAALENAQFGLAEVAPSFRTQNTATRPIPVVPRDAALRLKFSSKLDVDESFFRVNPAALQVLEFRGDPQVVSPVDAFRAVPFRLVVRGDTIIVDPTILGGETQAGFSSTGLPSSVDQVTANIRIAIPSRGDVAPAFYVREDVVTTLNDVDSFGRTSVIRDFRSGNVADGTAGTLRDPEPPMIIGSLGMGITSVDAANGVITLNKRLHQVPVRGRYPFVEGPISPTTLLPEGPVAVPTLLPLRTGDFLVQNVPVLMPDNSVERVRVRAEILQNLAVGTVRNDPTLPNLGKAADGTQGETLPVVQVRVGSVEAGLDSLGRPVSFTANALPEGADCTLNAYYYHDVRFLDGSGTVSDSTRRFEFLRIDPAPPATTGGNPNPPGTRVDPTAAVVIEFSKPMDLERIDATRNLIIANDGITGPTYVAKLADPKAMTAGLVPVRLSDQSGDSTVLQLQPPKGFFHRQGIAETYWFHLLLGAQGATDVAGNPVEVFADSRDPVSNWSVDFSIDQDVVENLVGWRVFGFESVDEDGTLPGSVDIFGQFRIQNGRLTAAETVRFSQTADNQNLGGISRIDRGECWDPFANVTIAVTNPPGHPGLLYLTPRMADTIFPPFVPPVFLPWQSPHPVGRVIEPHQPRGSRMMMRYLEDDFTLDYRIAGNFAIDVEQLYWSPYADENVLFDVYDRYTMSLAHSEKRPDVRFRFIQPTVPPPPAPRPPPICELVCPSMISSLRPTFAENVLQGSQSSIVFEDKVYRINPNDAFRSAANVKYVPYPRFDRTYTWRDSRLVTVDEVGQVIGLGGALDPSPPDAPNVTNDWTTNIDSPWIRSVPAANFPGPIWVMDEADFRGERRRDLDPIALPLLVDFRIFPDSSANGISSGANAFQVAMIGPPSNFALLNPGGYYNAVGVGCPGRDPWPWVRTHTTGGIDPNTNQDIFVDPANVTVAIGGFLKDAGMGGLAGNAAGLFTAPPGDGMLNWAQADFVRKVSTMTFGFFDTLQPQRRVDVEGTVVTARPGFPDFSAINPNLRGDDLGILMDPPLARQPAGTSLVLEFRGAATFANSNTLYNPNYTAVGFTPSDTFDGRGNLLNANYACEAYRYSQANSGASFDLPRVAATGLTRYVTDTRIDEIREPNTGLLPRFLNLRIVMANNVSVSPAVSPSLRSLALIWRMQPVQ